MTEEFGREKEMRRVRERERERERRNTLIVLYSC
jgi:hypothetical protein